MAGGRPRGSAASAAAAARRRRSATPWPVLLVAASVVVIFARRLSSGRDMIAQPRLHTRSSLASSDEPSSAGSLRRWSAGALTRGAVPSPPALPPSRTQQPAHKFLMFFSGHQGSSALADMLASHPSVFIPGFEPLDSPGLTPAQKLAFLEATFAFPAAGGLPAWQRWRAALLPQVPGLRVDRQQLRSPDQLQGKTVSGFKLRPYPLGNGTRSGGDGRLAPDGGSRAATSLPPAAGEGLSGASNSNLPAPAASITSNISSRSSIIGTPGSPHTALTGLDPAAARALLERHNVTVLLTLRRNRVKEALSWHKARDLGVSQFSGLREAPRHSKDGSRAGSGDSNSSGVISEGGGKNGLAALQQAVLQAAEVMRQLLAVAGSARSTSTAEVSAAASAAPSPASSGTKLRADIPRVLRWLDYTERVNEQLHEAVSFFGRPTLTIWYEDFLADPLGEAQRAAAFIGVPAATAGARGGVAAMAAGASGGRSSEGGQAPGGSMGAGLQLSGKFRKAMPDEIEDWLENFGELCVALRGTPHYRHLNSTACQQAAGNVPAAATEVASPAAGQAPGDGPPQEQPQTGARQAGSSSGRAELLTGWCTPADKAASGWGSLSDDACTERLQGVQAAAVEAVRNGTGVLLFKHVHKAGGSTLCSLAQQNSMRAEVAALPFRKDWDTNCVPYEAFLGPHPAVGGGGTRFEQLLLGSAAAGQGMAPAADVGKLPSSPVPSSPAPPARSGRLSSAPASEQPPIRSGRLLQSTWLGGACWLGFLTPPQLRALPHHYRPLNFVASEGPMPDAVPLDVPGVAWVTMLRKPADRVLSSYKWWRLMMERMPQSPAECHAYTAPANASLSQWLAAYPDNWQTRELLGRTALFDRRRKLTEADLRTAQQRLHLFSAVLLLERPKSSMGLMRCLFGWNDTDWSEHRAGSRHGSSAADELSAEELQLVRERNQLDERLYEAAEALHTAQVWRWAAAGGAVGRASRGGS